MTFNCPAQFSGGTSDETQVKTLMESMATAIRTGEVALLDRILTEDYVETGGNAAPGHKLQALSRLIYAKKFGATSTINQISIDDIFVKRHQFPFDILHYQISIIFIFKKGINRAPVRMVKG